MGIKTTEILHLKTVKKQDRCIVKGCHNWGWSRKGGGDYYVLCNGHRRLARDRYNGNIPENYVPALKRHIYPNHPKCIIGGCGDYCETTGVSRIGIRGYSRFCPFHDKPSNRRFKKAMRNWTDYTLPMPPLVKVKDVDLPICIVDGCDKPIKIGNGKNGNVVCHSRCPHHFYLHRLRLPDNYVPLKPKGRKRDKCIVDDCERMQANKGLYNGRRRYDLYCEYHRRGAMKVEKKGRLVIDKSKCSYCGWKGVCDRHRIVGGKDGGKYETGNVVSACPNCHRLLHRGIDPKMRLKKRTVLG